MSWQANSLSGIDNPSVNLYLDRNENKFVQSFHYKGTGTYTYLFEMSGRWSWRIFYVNIWA